MPTVGNSVSTTKRVGIPSKNAKLDIYSVSSKVLEARDGPPGGTSPRSEETTPLKGPGMTTDQSVDRPRRDDPSQENERRDRKEIINTIIGVFDGDRNSNSARKKHLRVVHQVNDFVD